MNRILIVNADDFGQSVGTNDGIVKAHRDGILTSASLMVCWAAAADAVERAGALSLGLHLDLGEWAFRDGDWVMMYERVRLDDAAAVETEVRNQLNEFVRLTGKTPTHLDSHQHVHMDEPLRTVATTIGAELGVVLRRCSRYVHYCGSFYGQSGKGANCPESISVAALLKLIEELPAGVTELACHPGLDRELNSTYLYERALEVEVLCHPDVREKVEEQQILLRSFAELNNSSHQR